MRKFVAVLKNKRKGELSEKLLSQHIEHLQKLNKNSKLFICGPIKDDDKAMQILICNTIDEAIDLVESDPFVKEGYYGDYEIYELIEANEDNNWLADLPQTLKNLKE
ncbi:YciI family protein [Alkalihalobacillus sp. TS-13]|uniref:YciI family protein n=1 Tax=Alkalihalobacillus sp. TS-13 TaxID=2842455 RepID=UPI001C88A501|nr:YciI family protein [Alkalihalobacillus sp. TS-13]